MSTKKKKKEEKKEDKIQYMWNFWVSLNRFNEKEFNLILFY